MNDIDNLQVQIDEVLKRLAKVESENIDLRDEVNSLIKRIEDLEWKVVSLE